MFDFYNIWLTDKCNFKCEYCYEKKIEFGNLDRIVNIEEKIVRFIADTVKNKRNFLIQFHGGEPLLEFKSLKKIVELLHSKEIFPKYSFTTNAIFLNKEIIDFCMANKFEISVSIDGNKFVFDKNRKEKNKKENAFDMVIKNTKDLISNKHKLSKVNIRGTYTPETVMYLKDSVDFLVTMNPDDIYMMPDTFISSWGKEDILILKEEILKINEKYMDNKKWKEKISLLNITFTKKDYCGAGKEECILMMNGDIYPCFASVGNEKRKIGTIEDGLYKENIQKIETLNNTLYTPCIGCKMYDYCEIPRCKLVGEVMNDNCNRYDNSGCEMTNLNVELKRIIG